MIQAFIKLLGHPAMQGAIALVGLVIAIAAFTSSQGQTQPTPAPAGPVVQPTAAPVGDPTRSPTLALATAVQAASPIPAQATRPNPTPRPPGAFPCPATVTNTSISTILDVVREFPNTSSAVISSISRGESLTVLERSGGAGAFYRVQRGAQTLGWVSAEYLVLLESCP